MIIELADKIWSHANFHAEAAQLWERNLGSRLSTDEQPVDFDSNTLIRLLRSAAALAASPRLEHRRMAYQIAVAATEIAEDAGGARYLLLCVLSRIGNFPALKYAQEKFNISDSSLPTRMVAESSIRGSANTVDLNGQQIALTDFQLNLWTELNSGTTVGISAPTSAGKSFILQAYARKQMLAKKCVNVGFLVPTRALINQVSDDVAKWVRRDSHLGTELVTTPIPAGTALPEKAVYVLTQERLQLIQIAHPALAFDLMIVDEAQSIGDGPRGVLLSSVISEALDRMPQMQLLFAGPNLKNPERLGSGLGVTTKSVKTDEATVSQNIIFVDCDEANVTQVNLSFRAENRKISLGSITVDQPLVDHRSKLITLALKLGAGGQSLVYAAGPAECEKIAFGLADFENERPAEANTDLSNFIKEAVHPKFQLAQAVLNEVGYHYGRLPSLVRKAIEDSFAAGQLKYLVTTSTLLYGVNLPAQNLFLHNPERGPKQPISPIDFWNLAGRAGRLGKEFTGNIFLIDYGGWETDPMSGSKDLEVIPALEQHVVQEIDGLIEYINDPARVPPRDKTDKLENTFVRLVRDQFAGTLDRTLDRLGLSATDPRRVDLVTSLQNVVATTKIKSETLAASPTVSIHRQEALYNRLTKSLKKKGPSYIIPKHPQDKNAYTSYLAAIQRCHTEVLKYPSTDSSHLYVAQMAVRWMRGDPLPMMIDANFEYRKKKGESPNISSTIRATLDEIESDLRFKYVRLFSCYNAVLELVLIDNNYAELLPSIPSIPMYLEVGACSPTMISFMGIGLSRYTAWKLNTLPRRSDMSQSEVKAWLRRQDITSLSLPSAAIHEIQRLVL